MRVEVVPYDERWAADFAAVRQELLTALAGVDVVAVEHVGSTSVPGLAAKPVLDVDVVVPAAAVPGAVAALEAVGYVHRGDLGIPGREAFTAPEHGPRRHVYVCVEGSLALRNHLAVRDTLRADPELRNRYAAAKLALADADLADMDAYVAGKNAVLQEVLARAGLSADELGSIAEVNPRAAG